MIAVQIAIQKVILAYIYLCATPTSTPECEWNEKVTPDLPTDTSFHGLELQCITPSRLSMIFSQPGSRKTEVELFCQIDLNPMERDNRRHIPSL